jgi:hypothetical protein
MKHIVLAQRVMFTKHLMFAQMNDHKTLVVALMTINTCKIHWKTIDEVHC